METQFRQSGVVCHQGKKRILVFLGFAGFFVVSESVFHIENKFVSFSERVHRAGFYERFQRFFVQVFVLDAVKKVGKRFISVVGNLSSIIALAISLPRFFMV